MTKDLGHATGLLVGLRTIDRHRPARTKKQELQRLISDAELETGQLLLFRTPEAAIQILQIHIATHRGK